MFNRVSGSSVLMNVNNTYRKKLLNAILYFASKVKNPSKVKIFKLLYFLDFKHFKETGRSVTNLDYYALDFGPVPLEFYEEVKDNNLPEDFSKALSLVPFASEESGKKGAMFCSKTKADLSVFSPREQRIMTELVDIFKDVDAKLISDVSHFKNHPWDKTRKEKGFNKPIDYTLAIDKEATVTLEDAVEQLREREEMLRNFPPTRTL